MSRENKIGTIICLRVEIVYANISLPREASLTQFRHVRQGNLIGSIFSQHIFLASFRNFT